MGLRLIPDNVIRLGRGLGGANGLSVAGGGQGDYSSDIWWQAQWKFDGNARDSIGSNHLTKGAASSPTFTTGKLNGATQLTAASSQYWYVADTEPLSMGQKDFFVAAWVYLDSKTGSMAIVGRYGNTGASQYEYVVGYNQVNDRFLIAIYNATQTESAIALANTFGEVSTGVWYHVMAWRDMTARTVNICVNNGAVDSAAETVTVSDTAARTQIGALKNGGTEINLWNGKIAAVQISKSPAAAGAIPTAAQRTILYNVGAGRYVAQNWTTQAALPNGDALLDAATVGSTDLAAVSPTLTKYASNPIFLPAGDNNDTWDYGKHMPSVVDIGDGTLRMWYCGFQSDAGHFCICYATSTDGVSWTKPNLGLVTYGGNTNNNIVVDNITNPTVWYYPNNPAQYKYLMVCQPATTISYANIYASHNGVNWTLINTINSPALTPSEPKSLLQLDSGLWVAYYVYGHAAQQRSLYGLISSSSNLAICTWADIGSIIPYGTTDADQKYEIRIEKSYGGIYTAYVLRYNNTTKQMHLDLWASRDGTTFVEFKRDWLALGADTTWDDMQLYTHSALYRPSTNAWRLYYGGCPVGHGAAGPDIRIGYAELGYRKMGGLTGTGTLVTTLWNTGLSLYIGSAGTVLVELLDAGDSVISGYSKNDCDAVPDPSDSFEVTWGGRSAPAVAYKIKFYVTAGTIYGYWFA